MLKAVKLAGFALFAVLMAVAPAVADECKWATEDEVIKGCHSDCGHFARDKEACRSMCATKPMKRYLPWTKKECTPALRKECHKDLASHMDSMSVDQSASTAYEAVIYYGCQGEDLPEIKTKP